LCLGPFTKIERLFIPERTVTSFNLSFYFQPNTTMNSFTSIPELTRNGQLFSTNGPMGKPWDHDINELFEQYAPTNPSTEAINPLLSTMRTQPHPQEYDHYDVEAVVPAREGALSLGMPVLRQTHRPTSVSEMPLFPVHMGYIPITEEEAFEHPVSEDTLQASRFTIPRGQMSVGKIIDLIRKVVSATGDIHEIAPKDTHSTQDRILYSSTLLYATFDQYGNHRFAQCNVRLQPVKDQDAESIAVIATHFQGDTRLSMALFLTLRAYVLSNGKSECKVRTTELFHGFADEYIDVMSEPTAIEFSSSEE